MKLTIVALTVLFSATAFGKGKSILDKCLDEATSNYAMKQCISQEYTRQDDKLNKEYKSLMETLKKDTSQEGLEIVTRVIKAERAWINFRDTSCAVDGIQMLGGSGEGLIVGECLTKLTRERANYVIGLQKTLLTSECEEGDISCRR